jgi:hypothetical protein
MGGFGRPPGEGSGPRPPDTPHEPTFEEEAKSPAEVLEIAVPKVTRKLRVPVIRDVLWYRGCKDRPVMVVLVRDPAGAWRDEALVATDPSAAATSVILGFCRRRSAEPAFFASKQYLGLPDPRVRAGPSVERAPPMAWFIGALVVLWYGRAGHRSSHVLRERPWHRAKVVPTFTDMRGALRLQMWECELFGGSGEQTPSPEWIERLLHRLTAVG